MAVRRLYFLRHGPAASATTWNGDDADRPLTSPGRKRVKCLVDMLARGEVAVDLIATSPLLRAQQTAEVAAKAFGAPVVIDDRLAPGFSAEGLAGILDRYSEHTAIMIVGHEPSFSAVLSETIGGGSIVVRKGAVARVDLTGVNPAAGELGWLVTPGSIGY